MVLFKKNFLTLLLLLCVLSVSATVPKKVDKKMKKHLVAKSEAKSFDVGMFKRESGMVALNFQKGEGDVVRIKIYDGQGRVVYKRCVKKHDLVSSNYDLSRLRPGKYYFEVSNKAKRYYFQGFDL